MKSLIRRFMLLIIFAAMGVTGASASNGEFVGKLEFKPSGCEQTGKCKITYDLKYRDPKGLEWQADAEDVTDGATIPFWAQPFIGKPFDPRFTKAAVIHDRYCLRHVRSWRATHRVFYDALLASDVDKKLAKLMYYGVYLGGPKWITLIEGKHCGSDMCVNAVPRTALKFEDSKYDEAGFADHLKAIESKLNTNPDLSLEELEAMAEEKRPGDFFYQNSDAAVIDPTTADSLILKNVFKHKDLEFYNGYKVEYK